MEEFLAVLKPDALKRRFVGEIISRLERAGFEIVDMRYGVPSKELVEEHYAHLKTRNLNAFDRNVRFMTEGPVVMLVLRGSVNAMRKMIGSTEPIQAAPGTIRGDLSFDSIPVAEREERGLHNLIHASDSPENGRAEVNLWRQHFNP